MPYSFIESVVRIGMRRAGTVKIGEGKNEILPDLKAALT
jgi:hypothetical protein